MAAKLQAALSQDPETFMPVIWTKDGIVDGRSLDRGRRSWSEGPEGCFLYAGRRLDHTKAGQMRLFGVVLQPRRDDAALPPSAGPGWRSCAGDFPAFSDGRAFSQAALPAAAGLGYSGELAGGGQLCCSTRLPLELRTGFGTVSMVSHAPDHHARSTPGQSPGRPWTLHYQPAADRTEPGKATAGAARQSARSGVPGVD